MMRFFLAIGLAAYMFASCSGKNKIPGGILSQSKMELLLWDMVSADEFVSDFVLKKDSTLDRKDESLKIYAEIFRIHQTNEKEFRKSLSFYQSHPTFLLAVLDSINAKHGNLSSRPGRLKLADSLKSLNKTIE